MTRDCAYRRGGSTLRGPARFLTVSTIEYLFPMHLFVYGSLLSAVPSSMSDFLARRADLVGPATVAGELYDLGMYPGLVAGGEGRVKGEVYRLHPEKAEAAMSMLDAYEGVTGEPEDEYRRVTVTTTLADGDTLEAETYEVKDGAGGRPVVPDGDYLPFYRESAAHRRFVDGG